MARPGRTRAPVDLSRFAGRPMTAEVLRAATEAVMAALTAQVEVLRGEPAPITRHDVRAALPAEDRQRTA